MKALTHICHAIRSFAGIPLAGRPKAKTTLSVVLGVTVTSAIFLFSVHTTHAVARTWDGEGMTNNWTEPANWSGNVVPGTDDDVTFDGTSAKPAIVNVNTTIVSLNITSGYTGAITIADGVTFNPSSATIAGGTFNVGGGTFNPGGSLPLNGGTLNGNTGTINVNFQMGINGNATFNGNSCTLNTQSLALNSGTFNSTSGNWTCFGFGLNGGTFDLDNGTITFVGGTNADISAPSSVTLNNVVINKSNNGTQLSFPSGTNVIQGTLTLNEGLLGGGTLKAQGAINIAATFGEQGVNTQGGGDGTLLIQDGAGPRTITLPAGVFLPTIIVNDANATINTSGAGTIRTARFTLQSGAVDIGSNDFTVGYSLLGGGPFTQSGGTFAIGSGNFTMNNTSAFTLSNGTFTATSGNLNLGQTAFNATQITGGTFNAPSGTMTCHSFIHSGGTFNGNGTLTIRGNFVHSAPAIFNPNNSSVIFRFNGSNPLSLSCPVSGTNFNNLTFFDVDIEISAGMPVVNGTFTHNAGFINFGQIHVKGDMVVQPQASSGTATLVFNGAGNQTFTNNGGQNLSGAWAVNKPSGVLTLASNLTLGASQALNITSGRLDLGPSFNLTAGAITIGAGGTLRNFGNGNLTLGGNLVNNGIFNFNGGGTACGDANAGDPLLIRSTSAGAARNWSGAGAFSIVDCDIQDQNATAIAGGVTANTSTNSGNNINFTFSASCPVEVTSQPTNQSACPGASANFTVAASGAGLSFKWRKNGGDLSNGGNISGAISNMLTINPVGPGDAGSYDVVVTNTFGVTATSVAVSLTVHVPAAVTGNPGNTTVCEGATASFTASANGSPVPTAQWQLSTDGGATFNNIGGATSTTLAFTAIASQNGHRFRAVFTNVCNSAPTAAAILTVNTAPTVNTNPTDNTVCEGTTANFSTSASGSPAPTVQWQVSTDGGATFNNVGGATSTTLSFTASASQNGNKFRAVFTNVCDIAATTPATLTVNTAPTVSANPTDNTVCEGATANFTTAANGSPAPTVQWQLSTDGGATFNNVGGATSTSLSFTPNASQNGHRFRAVFTNICNNATTAAATLTVNTAPTVSTNPADNAVCEGATANFTASGTGSPSPTVQWQVSTDGGATFNNIGGATSTMLSFAAIAAQNGNRFQAVFANVCNSATTAAATLTVNTAPSVNTNPIDNTVCEGATANFTASGTGSPAPSVQWQLSTDGGTTFNNLGGETSTTLSFIASASQNGHKFRAVFTNLCNSAMTTAATLTVNGFALSSTSQAFPCIGGSSSVNVTTAASCSWTAMSNDSFIHITGVGSGAGNGTVTFTVDDNCSQPARMGTMTIAGKTVTIDQSNPTAVTLAEFKAESYEDGILLEWQTGFEAENLGFNLYREERGQRTLINGQLVAGSALRANTTLRSGDRYIWWDKAVDDCQLPNADCRAYWLEDIDLKGRSTWHGPFYSTPRPGNEAPASLERARMLGELHGGQTPSSPIEFRAALAPSSLGASNQQMIAASPNAARIGIRHEGWYRVTQPELAAIGFNTRIDPRFLQLCVDGRKLPMLVEGEQDRSFDATDWIEFYGVGVDSPFTDSRVYWLTAGDQTGLRISRVKPGSGPALSQSYLATVERRDRTVYFAALRNGEKENFFGAVIARAPIDQSLTLSHVTGFDSRAATLEVTLQGVTFVDHRVGVELNGVRVGELVFWGQLQGSAKISVPHLLLREGENTVRLSPRGEAGDVSLVDSIRLSYQRSYTADADRLKLTAPGLHQITLDGFTSEHVRVIDITDPDAPQEILGVIEKQKAGYAIRFVTTVAGERSLLAFTTEQRPANLALNESSNLKSGNADLVIITKGGFEGSLGPLAVLRRSQGLSIAVVDVEDIYDEFTFGEKTPMAVRSFLEYANSNWKKKPRFVLFAGDGSLDPKNYLGFGDSDLVPAKLIDTEFMETSSDDWFSDFNGDGIADIATGRLPARTVEELSSMVAKIVRYEQSSPGEEALLVADANDGYDFERTSEELVSLIPASLRITQVNRGRVEPEKARNSLKEAIYRKQFLVNYVGHGSVNQWRGNLLTNEEALALRNEHLPLFVMMTCLNGYFQDTALDSLGESLLKAEIGGAVAVWASSGMTTPAEQALMNQALYRELSLVSGSPIKPPSVRIGEAMQRAKGSVSDPDIRRTWILLGDPTMRLR